MGSVDGRGVGGRREGVGVMTLLQMFVSAIPTVAWHSLEVGGRGGEAKSHQSFTDVGSGVVY